jgi:hypothetical protein
MGYIFSPTNTSYINVLIDIQINSFCTRPDKFHAATARAIENRHVNRLTEAARVIGILSFTLQPA